MINTFTGELNRCKHHNGVIFDDFTETEIGAYSQVCEEHAERFDSIELSDCTGTPVCGVQGCNETATRYLDFPETTEET